MLFHQENGKTRLREAALTFHNESMECVSCYMDVVHVKKSGTKALCPVIMYDGVGTH